MKHLLLYLMLIPNYAIASDEDDAEAALRLAIARRKLDSKATNCPCGVVCPCPYGSNTPGNCGSYICPQYGTARVPPGAIKLDNGRWVVPDGRGGYVYVEGVGIVTSPVQSGVICIGPT